MIPQTSKPTELLSLWGLVVPCVVLAVVASTVAFGVAAIFGRGISEASIITAATAAGICWTAASMALLITHLGNQLGARVQGVLAAMLIRMGLPLLALIGLANVDGPWLHDGLGPTILGTYLVTLLTETLLVVRMTSQEPLVRAT